jgi:hypothetical protein
MGKAAARISRCRRKLFGELINSDSGKAERSRPRRGSSPPLPPLPAAAASCRPSSPARASAMPSSPMKKSAPRASPTSSALRNGPGLPLPEELTSVDRAVHDGCGAAVLHHLLHARHRRAGDPDARAGCSCLSALQLAMTTSGQFRRRRDRLHDPVRADRHRSLHRLRARRDAARHHLDADDCRLGHRPVHRPVAIPCARAGTRSADADRQHAVDGRRSDIADGELPCRSGLG